MLSASCPFAQSPAPDRWEQSYTVSLPESCGRFRFPAIDKNQLRLFGINSNQVHQLYDSHPGPDREVIGICRQFIQKGGKKLYLNMDTHGVLGSNVGKIRITTHVVRLKLFRLKAEGVKKARLPYFG